MKAIQFTNEEIVAIKVGLERLLPLLPKNGIHFKVSKSAYDKVDQYQLQTLGEKV